MGTKEEFTISSIIHLTLRTQSSLRSDRRVLWALSHQLLVLQWEKHHEPRASQMEEHRRYADITNQTQRATFDLSSRLHEGLLFPNLSETFRNILNGLRIIRCYSMNQGYFLSEGHFEFQNDKRNISFYRWFQARILFYAQKNPEISLSGNLMREVYNQTTYR